MEMADKCSACDGLTYGPISNGLNKRKWCTHCGAKLEGDCVPLDLRAHVDASGLIEALEELARLGNGERPGNSIGNMIARCALTAYRMAKLPVISEERSKEISRRTRELYTEEPCTLCLQFGCNGECSGDGAMGD